MTESEIVHECWECSGCTTLMQHIRTCRSRNKLGIIEEKLFKKLVSKEHEKTTV